MDTRLQIIETGTGRHVRTASALRAVLTATTAILLCSGCASMSPYWVDRGRDAADIVTATLGLGAGAKVRAGPLSGGLLIEADGLGLRGGVFPDVSDERDSPFLPPTVDVSCVMLNTETFDSNEPLSAYRFKDFDAHAVGPFLSAPREGWRAPYYYTQFDIVAALGPSVRLGFNPGELLDFIVGWVGFDIFDDDIEAQRREGTLQPIRHPVPARQR